MALVYRARMTRRHPDHNLTSPTFRKQGWEHWDTAARIDHLRPDQVDQPLALVVDARPGQVREDGGPAGLADPLGVGAARHPGVALHVPPSAMIDRRMEPSGRATWPLKLSISLVRRLLLSSV